MRRIRKLPVALSLTGATALCDLVARIRRNAPHPGKSLRHQHSSTLQFGKYPTRGVDGIVDIFFAVGDGHKASLKR